MLSLHQPQSVSEACALMESLDEPMVCGGGTAIQIMIKQGLLYADNLVELSRIPGLADITVTETGLRVGPMVRLRQMERSPLVTEAVPLAAMAYARVANPRIRNTASVAGNIAHGDYRLDPPTALLVLDAQVELTSAHGIRMVPAREFFTDFQLTAIEHGELVTAIDWPRAPHGSRSTFVKMSSLAENDWPAASVAAMLEPTADGAVIHLGIGALAATPKYVRVDLAHSDEGLESAVRQAVAAVDSELDPIVDIRGSVEYKRQLGRVATEEAVTTLLRGVS